MADRIDPRIPDGQPSTSTYYELETGAVGRDYLQHFYNQAATTVMATDWRDSLVPLFDRITRESAALSADDVFSLLNMATVDNTALLQRVHSMVDINHIITVQHGEELERSRQRPDNRGMASRIGARQARAADEHVKPVMARVEPQAAPEEVEHVPAAMALGHAGAADFEKARGRPAR